MASTKNSGLSAADECRQRGWVAGTLISGDEGYGLTVIEITAVGAGGILARTIRHAGKPVRFPHEKNWTLGCRDWKRHYGRPA